MFGTSGIRGPVGETATADTAVDLAHALAACGYGRVVVGRDARESGAALTDALTAGLREAGVDVHRLGLAATPTVARSVAWYDGDAGVAVTASHNPPGDNGFKLWTPSGQAFDEDRREAVAAELRDGTRQYAPWDDRGTERHVPGARGGDPVTTEPAERHVEALCAAVSASHGDRAVDGTPSVGGGGTTPDDPLDLSVVVGVGNGVGGVTAEALDRLGCAVETLNARPDGRFPARPSEPTADNCASLSAHVAATDADLGVAHDGDADRMRAVDEEGTFLTGDDTLALFATAACGPGDRAAAPVDASLAVADALERQDAELVRTAVGDVYVARACREPGVVFGGEASGAWIWPEETLCPDGPLAACRLAALVEDRGPLSSLREEVPSYPIRRTNVETDRKTAVIDTVRRRVVETEAEVSTGDGVRVERDSGWFLLRASGTQPLVRVTAEARDADDSERLLTEARTLVEDAVGDTERQSRE